MAIRSGCVAIAVFAVVFGAESRDTTSASDGAEYFGAAEYFEPPLLEVQLVRPLPKLCKRRSILLIDLQVIMDDLQDKEWTLAALDETIADLMSDGDDHEEEVAVALEYHDKLRNTASHISATLSTPLSTRLVVALPLEHVPEHRYELPYRNLRYPFSPGNLACDRASGSILRPRSNRELSDIEKGSAKRAIEGVRLGPANYAVVIKVLHERYGRRDALVNEDIDSHRSRGSLFSAIAASGTIRGAFSHNLPGQLRGSSTGVRGRSPSRAYVIPAGRHRHSAHEGSRGD
ncbi:hypothetical protein HPB50_014546 [Hyalomma asiaticum]|uniref:Uncharacterized protein n=1 Tax=Hyalomma asiaticum TaxID=266040 RepID=A0ACB7TKL7_HYAAI|nr:hypothetical protein HPB50_014546 [Hyalomma asiaticum]